MTQTPWNTFQTTVGSINVRVTLYGAVSPERLRREHVIARHRAEQLQPVKCRSERIFITDTSLDGVVDEAERLFAPGRRGF